MASELHVDAIKHSGGTSAVSIDSAGVVDLSVNNNITMFQVNTTLTISSSTAVTITDWTEVNSQSTFGFQRVGSAVSVSNGVFTVSRLGVYRVYLQLQFYNQGGSADARYFQCDLRFTPNGGSMIVGDFSAPLPVLQSSYTYNTATRMMYQNFNHANDNIVAQLATSSSGNNYVKGGDGSSGYESFLVFEWLCPPVA